MLDVGLIGLGPDWESRYRPALLRLRHRLRVRSIYSAVSVRAEPVAEEFQCAMSHGFLPLLRRPDIKALLLLDNGWIDPLIVLRAARQERKPTYLARPCSNPALCSPELLQLGKEGLVTPELARRYTPATARLRELMASRLGPPQEIRIDVTGIAVPAADADTGPLAGLNRELLKESLDWCISLVGLSPAAVTVLNDGQEVDIQVEFRRPLKGGDPPRVSFHAPLHSTTASTATDSERFCCDVQCVAGRVEMTGLSDVVWEHQGERRQESLAHERADVEVLLDHFCRRVVGGLIPVPTVEDLWALDNLWHAAEQSAAIGKVVRLGGD